MTLESDAPKLTVISGGMDKKGKRSGKTETGLTYKQEAFCQAIAEGLSNTEAYRRAYDTASMKAATVHNEACKLVSRPDIAARIDHLIKEKKARNSIFTDKQREKYSDRVWRNLWAMIDAPETPPAVKANLLSLGAKAAGMLTEQVKIENISPDSASIEAEILERLQRLKA